MKTDRIEKELSGILKHIKANDAFIDQFISEVHKDYRLSAKNLMHYLILRSFDLRKYHSTLSDLGLSSIRTSENHVISNLVNIVRHLKRMLDQPFESDSEIHKPSYKKSRKLLTKHANTLFGKSRKRPFTEIMVTLPTEAAEDIEILRGMATNGMEIARINLGHDEPSVWTKMVENIKEVSKETGQEIKIYMDLSGPKIRTAEIQVLNKKGNYKNRMPVREGEHLVLTKRKTIGRKSFFGEEGEQIEVGEIGITLPQIINDAQVGEKILFDDGMVEAEVIEKEADKLKILITRAYKTRIGSNKGINLPMTKLNLPALTPFDIECLPFALQHADIIGYSFVRNKKDVKTLYTQLKKHNAKDIGVVLKIENKEAFDNLPEILISGMQRNNIGIMIARGDLAVEIGFERIAEVQNEILWLCEAAHIPVIWATQVLETLAKTGVPTRAEISDASQGANAECVMLNKGPYINNAIRILRNILIRMEGHSFKKKAELRALNISKDFLKKLNIEKPTYRQPKSKTSQKVVSTHAI